MRTDREARQDQPGTIKPEALSEFRTR